MTNTTNVVDVRRRLVEQHPHDGHCGWDRRSAVSTMWCRLPKGHDGGCVLRSTLGITRDDES